MVTGRFVFLATLFMEPHPTAAALGKVVANIHLQHGADAGEGVDHRR